LWDVGVSTLLIYPESQLVGKSLCDNEFRSLYNLHVLGMRRAQEAVDDYLDIRLEAFDSLLVFGRWTDIDGLRHKSHDFVVMETPAEHADVVPSYRKMPMALAILAGMVMLSVFDLMPLPAAVILAGLAAVATHCLTLEDAYRSIHWSSVVLVAGMLPLADALDKTGGTDIVVGALMQGVGDIGPYGMMTVLFFLTAALGLFLSNTASAVLVAPVAILAAESLGVSPFPFAIAVLIAASAAFVTPFSTPVVTLVVEPGKYRFADFIKLGVPLLVLTWITTLLVTPLVFPFGSG
jgi:di/tricarboxylate transporter